MGLTHLYLSENQLTGDIPPSLGNLSSLIHLVLNNNKLSGEIPSSLGDLSSLKWLYLSYNKLNGSIPSTIGKLGALTNLNLYEKVVRSLHPLSAFLFSSCSISTITSSAEKSRLQLEAYCCWFISESTETCSPVRSLILELLLPSHIFISKITSSVE
jgi:Leucine-rich repeat (LRR) protein